MLQKVSVKRKEKEEHRDFTDASMGHGNKRLEITMLAYKKPRLFTPFLVVMCLFIDLYHYLIYIFDKIPILKIKK